MKLMLDSWEIRMRDRTKVCGLPVGCDGVDDLPSLGKAKVQTDNRRKRM